MRCDWPPERPHRSVFATETLDECRVASVVRPAGDTGAVDGARTNFTGTVAVIGSRKRFEAVRGEGTLAGTRYTPLSEGADLFSEYAVDFWR